MKCPKCKGDRYIEYRCSSCNGSGEGRWDGSTCRDCKGMGEFREWCDNCDGEGNIQPEENENEQGN